MKIPLDIMQIFRRVEYKISSIYPLIKQKLGPLRCLVSELLPWFPIISRFGKIFFLYYMSLYIFNIVLITHLPQLSLLIYLNIN